MAQAFEADDRLSEIVEALQALARYEFGTTAPISDRGDVFDALAVGVNMLGEELAAFQREVEDRAAALSLANQELARRALYDSLTGLANRALFQDRLSLAMAALAADGTPVALMAIDLDGLKEVNDSLGHAAGDEMLIEVARRLQSEPWASETAARSGGDEFSVLLLGPAAADAEDLARKLAARLREPFDLEGQQIRTSASIGIAHGFRGQEPEALGRGADMALYVSKSARLGVPHTYQPSMHDPIARRLLMSSALRGAVDRNDLTVAYQPIVELATRSIVGFEALARWHDPVLGDVSPAVFIPLAEQIGVMRQLGDNILLLACREAAGWQSIPRLGAPPYVSVNLSAVQMQDPALPGRVADAMSSTGLPAEALMLEVTETRLMERIDAATDVLTSLRSLGLQIAIDDFGTGYSSLNYLRRLPVDLVKIDRAFIAGIGTDWEGWSFAQAMVRLIGRLGLKTLAEGVEDPAQVAHALAMGCDMAQGYYFGRPMPPESTRALLLAEAGGPVVRGARKRSRRAVGSTVY